MSHLSTTVKGFTPLFLFLILCFSVFAYTSYPNVGADNFLSSESTLFNQYTGDLDTQMDATETNLPRALPVFADLNNDGIIEYVSIDDNVVSILRGETDLTILSQYNLPIIPAAMKYNANYFYSNPAIYDTDGNGLKDIVIGIPGEQSFYFLEYNSTLQLSANLSINSAVTKNISYISVECLEPYCAAVVVDSQNQSGSVYARLLIMAINKTTYSSVLADYDTTTNSTIICPPESRVLEAADWNNDGKLEYGFIYGYHTPVGTGNDALKGIVFSVANAIPEFTFIDSISQTDHQSYTACSGNLASSFNSLYGAGTGIFADIQGDSKLEFIAPYCKYCRYDGLGTGIRVSWWDSSGQLKDTYPKILGITGSIDANMPGNIFIVDNAFTSESSKADVCAVSYAGYRNAMNVMCFSESSFFDDNYEIEYTTPFNFTYMQTTTTTGSFVNSSPYHDYLVHAIEAKSQSPQRNEIFTAYGIFEIAGAYPETPSVRALYPLITSIYSGSWIPISDDQNGLNDFLVQTSDALYYVDDGLYNKNCVESDCLDRTTLEICPDMIDGVAMINTTLRIRALWNDYDGDSITYNLTIYGGTSNQQSVVRTVSSNYYCTDLGLKLNQTTTEGIITLSYYDSTNPTYLNTWTETFNVQESGQAFSTFDCYFIPTIETETPGEDNTGGSLNTSKENAITGVTSEIQKYTNLKKDIVWLFLMLMCAIVPVIAMIKNSEQNKAGYVTLIIFVEIVMLIIGIKMGFLGVGVLITIIAVCAIAAGLWIRSLVTGGGQAGG